jgi:hypothetical protein
MKDGPRRAMHAVSSKCSIGGLLGLRTRHSRGASGCVTTCVCSKRICIFLLGKNKFSLPPLYSFYDKELFLGKTKRKHHRGKNLIYLAYKAKENTCPLQEDARGTIWVYATKRFGVQYH